MNPQWSPHHQQTNPAANTQFAPLAGTVTTVGYQWKEKKGEKNSYVGKKGGNIFDNHPEIVRVVVSGTTKYPVEGILCSVGLEEMKTPEEMLRLEHCVVVKVAPDLCSHLRRGAITGTKHPLAAIAVEA